VVSSVVVIEHVINHRMSHFLPITSHIIPLSFSRNLIDISCVF